MPYRNLPNNPAIQSKMERCVADVRSQGHDKKAAIAICYSSIMGTRRKEKYEGIDFSPPQGVIDAARRGLELRQQFGRGGTVVGIARARTLSNGMKISPETAKRMASFFARHAVDRRANWADPTKPTNGYIAHMLWGGDDGMAWATKLVRQMKARDAETLKAGGMTVLPTGTATPYTSVIAALWVDRELGNTLAIPPEDGGTLTPLPPEELHITLCFLGDAADIQTLKNQIIVAMAHSAMLLPPIEVKVGGLGQFFPQDGDSALYASIDSPELGKWRDVLKQLLESQGVVLDDYSHGFTPHITLGYTSTPTDLGDVSITPMPVPFTHLTLAWAGELIHFPLLGGGVTTKAEEGESGGAARSRSDRASSSSDSKPKKSSSSSSSSSSGGGSKGGANWGAKAGETIRGRLIRGEDGKFAASGSAPAKAPAKASGGGRAAAKPKAAPKAAAKPKATGAGSRGGKTLAQQMADRALRERERQAAKIKREQERQADRAKRETERAEAKKKREEERAAREAKRAEGKGGGKGEGKGGKGGDDKKGAEAKKKKVYTAIDKLGEGDKLSDEETQLLIDEGLVVRGPDGRLVLTEAGKKVQREEQEDDKRKEVGPRFKAFARNIGGGIRREELQSSDFVLAGERKFPVMIAKDVRDAVSSWGRYRGKTSFETFKRNLIALAKRKGTEFVAALPASWSVKESNAHFLSFKQADGQYRWVLFSSNAYRDRDREIVSRKALAEDVAYMDATGNYGPLRWWHMPGVELGTCDFNGLFGNILIESGTFIGPATAKAIAARPQDFQASIGFRHPPDEPDADGVFHHIRRFERSLLPTGRAANNLTALAVHYKAGTMDTPEILAQKKQALSERLGEEAAKEVLASAQQIEIKAAADGIAFKAKADGEGEPDAEMKADEAEEMVEAVADVVEDATEEEDMEDEDEEIYISDMTLTQFGEMMAAALADALAPVLEALDIESKMAAHTDKIKVGLDELKGMYATRKEATDADTARTAQVVASLETRLKELQDKHNSELAALMRDFEKTKALAHELAGETPSVAKGYRASTAAETATDANHRLKGVVPSDDADMIGRFLRPLTPQPPR